MSEAEQQTKAAIIKAVWESLVEPNWDYNNLVEFGKLIYGRTALKDIPKAKFDALMPFLVKIAEGVASRLDVAAKKPAEPKTEEAGEDAPPSHSPAVLKTTEKPAVPRPEET